MRQLLAPFVLRRVKADVQPQMAGKVETERLLEMSPAQQTLYASLLATAAATRSEKKAPKKASASARQATPAQALRLSQTVARNLFFDLRKAAHPPARVRVRVRVGVRP